MEKMFIDAVAEEHFEIRVRHERAEDVVRHTLVGAVGVDILEADVLSPAGRISSRPSPAARGPAAPQLCCVDQSQSLPA